jgi:hypothetical protein
MEIDGGSRPLPAGGRSLTAPGVSNADTHQSWEGGGL